MRHPKAIIALMFTVISVSCIAAPEVQSVDVWQVSDMKGHMFTLATHVKDLEAIKSPSRLTEEDKVRMRAAFVDNSSMPKLPQPVDCGETGMKGMTLTVGRFADSTDTPDKVTAIAKAEYQAGGEDMLIGYRDAHIDTYVLVGAKVSQVYTIHRNVRCEDGGYLVTLVGTRNSPIGLTTMYFSGSAKRVK